jgi:hypothetical protein
MFSSNACKRRLAREQGHQRFSRLKKRLLRLRSAREEIEASTKNRSVELQRH